MPSIKEMLKKAKAIYQPPPPPNFLFMSPAPTAAAPKGVRLNGFWYPNRKEALRWGKKKYRKAHDIPKAEKKDVQTILFEQGSPSPKQQRMDELTSQGFSPADALYKMMAEDAQKRGDTATAENHMRRLSPHQTPSSPPKDDGGPIFYEDPDRDPNNAPLNPNKGH